MGLINFYRIKDNKVIYQDSGTASIIASCFDFCTEEVKRKVALFLATTQQQITLSFEDYKIRLTKT